MSYLKNTKYNRVERTRDCAKCGKSFTFTYYTGTAPKQCEKCSAYSLKSKKTTYSCNECKVTFQSKKDVPEHLQLCAKHKKIYWNKLYREKAKLKPKSDLTPNQKIQQAPRFKLCKKTKHTEVTSIENSVLRDQIEAYLGKGGKVTRISPAYAFNACIENGHKELENLSNGIWI